jgi:hypothetical protein
MVTSLFDLQNQEVSNAVGTMMAFPPTLNYATNDLKIAALCWTVFQAPIEVTEEQVVVRVKFMEVGRPYRFEWGGVELFAIRRDENEKVDVYAVKGEGKQSKSKK